LALGGREGGRKEGRRGIDHDVFIFYSILKYLNNVKNIHST
jgi:hypothetical protein